MKCRHKYALPFSFYVVVFCTMVALAVLGSRAVEVIAENSTVIAKSTVIIDAGHGGIDGGATSCNGIMEKDLNLEIATRLEDLMHLLGVQTLMIRRDDSSVHTSGDTIATKKVSDLKNRVNIVNSTPNSFLISIHQNYFQDSQYHGGQIFYAQDAVSSGFAEELQAKFNTLLTPGSNREAKKATGIYLMEHIKSPGILVECGFLSNFDEEVKLRNADYQKKICCLIATQTNNYLNQKPIA